MQDVAKTSLYFAGCVAVIGSIAFGNLTRTQIEIGPNAERTKPIVSSRTLVASNTPGTALSESEYFYVLTQLLDARFVDPITDRDALAQGAVRAMIGRLKDPDSIFLGKEELAALQARQRGQYAGIGAELYLKYDMEQLNRLTEDGENIDPMFLFPSVIVQSVMPGSPAANLGLESGDRIMAIDDHWALSYEDFQELRDMQEESLEGDGSTADVIKLREELTGRIDTSLTASKVYERLLLGEDVTHQIKWQRGGEVKEGQITTKKITVEPVSGAENLIQLKLFRSAAEALQPRIAGSGPFTIDLRNSGDGDQQELEKVMGLLGAKGVFGTIDSPRMKEPRKLTTPGGKINPASLTLIVDESTSGTAEMLARALAAQGAKLEGSTTADDLAWKEIHELPDGSGYALAVGRFVAPAKEIAQ